MDPQSALLLAALLALLVALARLHAAPRHGGAPQPQAGAGADTDPATGLPNRQGFALCFEAARRGLMRDGRPLTLLILDIDHFKGISDRLGAAVGSQVVADFVGHVREAVGGAPLARLGGEEFAVLVPMGSAEALLLAHRIRAAVEAARGRGLPVYNCSIGLATATTPGHSLEALLGAADRALYYARQEGRTRVASATPEADQPLAMERS